MEPSRKRCQYACMCPKFKAGSCLREACGRIADGNDVPNSLSVRTSSSAQENFPAHILDGGSTSFRVNKKGSAVP